MLKTKLLHELSKKQLNTDMQFIDAAMGATTGDTINVSSSDTGFINIGDQLIAVMLSCDESPTATAPAGWNLEHYAASYLGTEDFSIRIWSKIATSAEIGQTLTFTRSDTHRSASVTILAFENAGTFQQAGTLIDLDDSSTIPLPGITSTGGMVVGCCHVGSRYGSPVVPSGWTLLHSETNSNNTTVLFFNQDPHPVGATGNVSVDMGDNDEIGGALFEFTPN